MERNLERISVFAPNRTRESRHKADKILFAFVYASLTDLTSSDILHLYCIFPQVMDHMHGLHRTPSYQKSLGNQPKTKGVYLCHPETSIKVLLITQGATLHLPLSLLLIFYLPYTSFKQSQPIQRP